MARPIHYLFDIDGTLTMPRRKMSDSFLMSFLSWMQGKSIFLVAGSDMEKINYQVPNSVTSRCSGIFCSMANEFWSNGQYVYRKEWKPSIKLLSRLTEIRRASPYETKKGNWLEHRMGMINFSVAGRDSNLKERKKYYEWDKGNKERLSFVKTLSKEFPHLDLRIGGQISVDITPRGSNKSLASKWIRNNLDGQIYFFGDSCFEGGNDYDICVDVDQNEDGKVFSVNSADETLEILKGL